MWSLAIIKYDISVPVDFLSGQTADPDEMLHIAVVLISYVSAHIVSISVMMFSLKEGYFFSFCTLLG